jgi:hypothetical protein
VDLIISIRHVITTVSPDTNRSLMTCSKDQAKLTQSKAGEPKGMGKLGTCGPSLQ